MVRKKRKVKKATLESVIGYMEKCGNCYFKGLGNGFVMVKSDDR